MKTIFSEPDYLDIVQRIERLKPDAPRQWGRMNAAQMLTHISLAMEVSLGMVTIPSRCNWVFRNLVKPLVFTCIPMPKNSPTSEYLKIADERDFAAEKQRFLTCLQAARERGSGASWTAHAAFGPLTGTEWGKLHYKHTDHHLKQFAV